MSTYKNGATSLVQVSRAHNLIHPDRRGLPPSFRRNLFLHQDGFILTMVIGALQEREIMNMFLDRRALTVSEIIHRANVNRGYIHVALRCLAQEGWLTRSGTPGTDELSYQVTDAGMAASIFFPLYAKMATFMRLYLPFDKSLFTGSSISSLNEYERVIETAISGWGLRQTLAPLASPMIIGSIHQHLDGNLVIGTLVGLLNMGRLEAAGNSLFNDASLAPPLRFLEHVGWVNRERREWTEEGLVARENVLHYCMVGSYFPMLVDLPRMLYSDSVHRTHLTPGAVESHVDRRLNVLASAAAHRKYFMDADEIFIDIFNREPVSDQPSFVADCGCGDGSWLKHIYEVVLTRTMRGLVLEKHPLLMIGTDYNEAALEIARNNLIDASIPSLMLFGDITDPGRLARDLDQHGIDIRSGLHIRSFIDHNRCYGGVSQECDYNPGIHSSGAYVDETGALIPNRLLEMDLVESIKRWRPYVGEHGLVLLEAHCVEPHVTARHLGDVHNLVFDTYHGFSRQYPADFEVFIDAVESAGFKAALYHQKRYPSRKPFVSISINRLIAPDDNSPIPAPPHNMSRSGEWKPNDKRNIDDGEALHGLLYHGGDINKPRKWCAAASGALVRSVLSSLNAQCDRVRRGEKPPSVSVVDYGTGTGLAAIEILKSCRETGLFRRFETYGIDFKIHLLDIPSGWFAKGYQLLKDCPYVHFHSIRSLRTGEFLKLTDILSGEKVDLIIASMVFHLIPGNAIPKLFRDFSEALNKGGALIWNSPDIGPADEGSVLFHDPNRRMRKRALELIERPEKAEEIVDRLSPAEIREYQSLKEKIWRAHHDLTPEKRATAASRADRQILPTATNISYFEEKLEPYFSGEIFTKSFEMLPIDSLDTILIPSNQRYLTEIEEETARRDLIRLLMTREILPHIHDSKAGTAYGFSVQWTFGEHYLKS